MPAALRELARHRTENTVPFRSHLLTLLLDEHDRILIKADIRTVLAGKRLSLPHDDGAINILLLHLLARLGGLYGDDDDIPDARIATIRSAEHLEDSGDFPAGIVCDCYDGSRLQHI